MNSAVLNSVLASVTALVAKEAAVHAAASFS
jgi:hypothetical protein